MEFLDPPMLLIAQIGFPSAVAVYLLVSRNKREAQHDKRYESMAKATNERLRQLTEAIQSNTQVMAQVVTKI
jgi:hypothetical protein